ncbi:MAG: HNH endonuclease [Mesorhizobium sp.]|nr:HNH endonuclease [Mesorhizobium sp.]
MSYADRYRADDPDRKFLQSRVWREKIRPAQLAREPLCRFCAALGYLKEARHVDHITRPRGDRALQRDPLNHQSLCPEHHASKSAWERTNERHGSDRPLIIGTTDDGWTRVTAPGGTIPRPDLFDDQPTPKGNNHKSSENRFTLA